MKAFDPTKPVQLRDGTPARIICTDRAAPTPIVALVKTHDVLEYVVYRNEDFFYEAAPKESPGARLDRFLDFLKRVRPHGIIEIVLVSSQSDWFPFLEERGFKIVSEAKNSNTSNKLHVFHLCY